MGMQTFCKQKALPSKHDGRIGKRNRGPSCRHGAGCVFSHHCSPETERQWWKTAYYRSTHYDHETFTIRIRRRINGLSNLHVLLMMKNNFEKNVYAYGTMFSYSYMFKS